MIEVGAFAAAGGLWLWAVVSLARDRTASRRLRIATGLILALAVPIVLVVWLTYGRR